MTRPSEASVVPIRLTLDGRSGVTLWATPWVEDGEQWQAFLGSGERVLVFGDLGELADFLASHAYDRHVRAARLRYSRRRERLVALLDEFPQLTVSGVPAGLERVPDDMDQLWLQPLSQGRARRPVAAARPQRQGL